MAGRAAMLNSLGATMYCSAHSDAPLDFGANEIATARQLVTFGVASGGQRLLATQPTLSIPANTRVRYLGFWSLATNGTFLAYWPLDGDEREYIVLSDNRTIWSLGHGFTATGPIVFMGSAPGGLTVGTPYYAVAITTHTFQVSATPGAGVGLTISPQTADSRVSQMLEQLFGSAGQLAVNRGVIATATSQANNPPAWNQSVAQINLTVGQQFNLNSICADADGDLLAFLVNGGAGALGGLATINSAGVITAVAPGQTTATFIADDGK